MSKFWAALTRRKTDDVVENESQLARVLNLFDLTALGVGSTLGLGVYVLAGSVAYNIAGPAVTISFLIAALASAFAGICYAEFAARVPKAGSAYVYSYVTIGEFVAFTIGWNLILEYVIGTASVARGLSGYFDALIDNSMSKALTEAIPMHVDFLAKYPDFLAMGVILLLAALLAFGVKESSFLNNIFTTVNLITIAIVLVAGAINANPANWSIPKDDVPETDNNNFGSGGFMPFGIAGVMTGAAKCFYGFVGFDCIATTGEEAINPKRNIPLAIVISLIIIFLSYFGISTVLTMMVPYFELDKDAPFPKAFDDIGWSAVKWIVTIGAVFALTTSLLGAMFPLPRVLYAMGNDGILFKSFSKVHNYTQTPLLATIISGIFAGIMALIFDLDQLIDMMSIGTLLAYTIVAICVLVLRYQDEDMDTKTISVSCPKVIRQFFNGNSYREPNLFTSRITKIAVVVFALVCIVWDIVEALCGVTSTAGAVALGVIGVLLIFIVVIIGMQPVSTIELTFKVPLVPFIPCLSVFVNVYLMFQLDVNTWIRFLVWVAIGYAIYFSYGLRNSTQVTRNRNHAEAAIRMQHTNQAFEPDWKVENGVNRVAEKQ
ncbi:PREDICTED: cationic amino acid transporter 3 [Bactrocera latifrons]|uniref:High affinity cationic amino acid transporter 1 n=1 Tax=Bactrocera latifrons TaxID=174628 RepID=A0A0K8WKD0_BACLA|nr:PREDICTED: cationic amino acid transporter 3 [Bactrocera latifrons]XP_018800355.1 PREDICTED: cationic amino acid transporter 3 [Bactrocera latifrons]XP_018800356.1 PREDICTED: cationic amino acid transporter 3 [Bactrocera latifrons]XP_018800358.1 PREDICTED: cationic amino acid transporter 3 [Bactrocera latifrons]XP_018800359.1 PREDICTED: cationic amino acid transporter 3 [Bactrocera latifrons]XP_018800360.1 PREDICTED: cationic amino acid transporter 3 [Bactrocera latifrons]